MGISKNDKQLVCPLLIEMGRDVIYCSAKALHSVAKRSKCLIDQYIFYYFTRGDLQMNFKMTKIAAGLVLLASASGAQAITLTFANGPGVTGTYAAPVGYTDPWNSSAFTVNAEFRMVDPSGALGGGNPLNKSTINGGETWGFNNTGNLMTSVSGTANTVGTFDTNGNTISIGSAADTGGAGLDQGAIFFGNSFGFLAPMVGTQAGTAYGPATINLGGLADGFANMGDTFSIHMNVAEAQWGGTYFPLANVTFSGTITDGIGGYSLTSYHLITGAEDPGSAGFAGWTAQWNYKGTISDIAPVPEASTYGMMLAGLGLVGFAVRRRNRT